MAHEPPEAPVILALDRELKNDELDIQSTEGRWMKTRCWSNASPRASRQWFRAFRPMQDSGAYRTVIYSKALRQLQDFHCKLPTPVAADGLLASHVNNPNLSNMQVRKFIMTELLYILYLVTSSGSFISMLPGSQQPSASFQPCYQRARNT
jgi:hypothetical protein